MSILNKLEIDVTQANEVQEATSFAAKYNLPALVVHPSLALEGIYARGRAGGKYKIITPIDWPKGENFGMLKMRGINLDALDTDGYEILLTPNKTEIETRNEIQVLTEFIRSHISTTAEIRFVLGSLVREQSTVLMAMKGLLKNRLPFLMRNDIHTKIQATKANADIHSSTYNELIQIVKIPIKVSGNIASYQIYNECQFATRFGVNLAQAKSILKDFKTVNNLQ
jgi:hypothetical protein